MQTTKPPVAPCTKASLQAWVSTAVAWRGWRVRRAGEILTTDCAEAHG